MIETVSEVDQSVTRDRGPAERWCSRRSLLSGRRGAALAVVIFAATFLAAALRADAQAPGSPTGRRPNFVVLLVDDAAFMDFGAFGGEARTPNIDRLAAAGTMFTRYRTSPLCSPSRAMLLTGVDNHRTGVATIPEVLPSSQSGKPGYSLHLEEGVTTVAERLRRVGYRTYMTGKWHLGGGEGQLPDAHGFDRSFALEASGADNWEHKSYMPYYADAPWYEDGKPARFPDGTYSSQFIVDRMISYIDGERDSQRPFFGYLAFQAVHIPVQAPRDLTAGYEGVFDAGWDVLREARWHRAQAMGFVPAGATPPPLPPKMRPWASLSEPEKRLATKSMAVYAAMLEAMDREIGRLVAHLESISALENTVFLVTSDNGPEPSDPGSQNGFGFWMRVHGYDHDIETLGERGSHNWIGPEWASAVATPGRLFKFYATEGGVHVPLVVSGPDLARGARSDAAAWVTDITPTILDLAGAPAQLPGAVSMDGRSLTPVLRDSSRAVYGPEDAIGLEVSGNAALFRGDMKLVRIHPPYGDGSWLLYDLARDPGEAHDLAAERPEVFESMKQAYAAYALANGVLDMPEGYQVEKQVVVNSLKRQVHLLGWSGWLAVLVVLAALAYGVRSGLRRRRGGRT